MKLSVNFNENEFAAIKTSLNRFMKKPLDPDKDQELMKKTSASTIKMSTKDGGLSFDVEAEESATIKHINKVAYLIGETIPKVMAAIGEITKAVCGKDFTSLISKMKDVGVKSEFIPDIRATVTEAAETQQATKKYTRRILVGEKIGRKDEIEMIISVDASTPEAGNNSLDQIEYCIKKMY